MVVLDRVAKRFGETHALRAVSLEIRRGEFFALLGPSGSGKSTLLGLIAGFHRPTSGRIAIDGVDVTDVPAYERHLGMVFQNYSLFPHLDVRGNVGFGLRMAPRTPQRSERPGEPATLLDRPLEGPATGLRGTVVARAWLGRYADVTVRLASGVDWRVQVMDGAPGASARVGDDVLLTADPDAVVVL